MRSKRIEGERGEGEGKKRRRENGSHHTYRSNKIRKGKEEKNLQRKEEEHEEKKRSRQTFFQHYSHIPLPNNRSSQQGGVFSGMHARAVITSVEGLVTS